jgi:hypothetical protein
MMSTTGAFPLIRHRRTDQGVGTFVRDLGVVSDAFATIQIDLNVVSRDTGGEITLCDHNCTTTVDGTPTGGSYTCPAAMSLNRGARRTSLAPAAELIRGLRTTIDGIAAAQDRFLASDLDAYLDREGVPADLRPEFRAALSTRAVTVNLFGGSPETHPQVLDIIADIRAYGAEVHLTTTGRRLLRDGSFRAELVERPPDVIALGADDFESVDDVDHLFGLGYEELSALWRGVSWRHGQRRKAIEAVQVSKLAERHELPPLLFNIVLHAGNLDQAGAILDRLAEHVPAAALNPYPVQTAFLGKPGELGTTDLARLGRLVDEAIDVHAARQLGRRPRWNLVPRLGYWLLMRALLDKGTGERPVGDLVGGEGVWRCYTRRGAGRCVQVGIAAPGSPPTDHPGGHLGCFWNTETVTDSRQFWTLDPRDVADWMLDGRAEEAARAPQPCRGCLFPRMSMDAVSIELGLAPHIAPDYRQVRARYLGY